MYLQLFFQLIVFFITALVLDFGVMTRCFVISMTTYWCIVCCLCLYSSERFSDGLFFRFGIIPIFLAIYLVKTSYFPEPFPDPPIGASIPLTPPIIP